MKKKILLAIPLVVVAGVLGLLAFAVTRPDRYHVERRIDIAAPRATVFAAVNDFRRWENWSPWEGLDPAMTKTFDGPERGLDASYAWAGNDEVGKGKMTIVGSEPDTRIHIRLEFHEPWQTTNETSFVFEPIANGTQVTWGMDGTNNFLSKVFTIFMNVDRMIGSDFEKGLANLKTLAESAPADSTATAAVEHS